MREVKLEFLSYRPLLPPPAFSAVQLDKVVREEGGEGEEGE